LGLRVYVPLRYFIRIVFEIDFYRQIERLADGFSDNFGSVRSVMRTNCKISILEY